MRLDLQVTVFETPYDRKVDDREARNRCLEALVRATNELGVSVLVLDTRGPDRDRQDRVTVALTVRAASLDRLTYAHRGSRDEPLIALPDAFGWAAGAGKPWRRLIELSASPECRSVGGWCRGYASVW
jgi:hypothetical protein